MNIMRKKLFKISGRHLLLLSHFLIFSFSQPLFAQTQPFTERLQKAVSGQGTVRLHQDADIVALVNGTARRSVTTTRSLLTSTDSLLSANDSLLMGTGRKVRMNGYRVQAYAGGNSRDAKRRQEALPRATRLHAFHFSPMDMPRGRLQDTSRSPASAQGHASHRQVL